MFKKLFAVLLIATVSIGCGGAQIDVPSPPAVVEGIDQNLQLAKIKGLQLLVDAAKVANRISIIEDEAARSGVIPANVDMQFDAAMLAFVRAMRSAEIRLNAADATWDDIREHLSPLLIQLDRLMGIVDGLKSGTTGLKAWVTTLREIVAEGFYEILNGETAGGAA